MKWILFRNLFSFFKVPILLAFGIVYYPLFCIGYPTWYRVIIFIDTLFVMNIAFAILQMFVLFNLLSSILSFYYILHLNDIIKQFKRELNTSPRNSRISSTSLQTFLIEHLTVCNQINKINVDFIAKMMLVFLICNIPLNIYAVSHLVLDTLPQYETHAFQLLILIQVTSAASLLIPMAFVQVKLYDCKKLIPLVQYRLTRVNKVYFKLKCDDLLSRLTSGTPYCFSIGPSPLTCLTLFKVFKLDRNLIK